MTLRTGRQYLESLRDGRRVWLLGEQVDVTEHPLLAPGARSVAQIYDLYHAPEHRDLLTFEEASDGARQSLAYLFPHSKEDLVRRRQMTELVMRRTGAVFGRPPDFVPLVLLGLWDVRKILAEEDPRFAKHVEDYVEYCRSNDVCLTHGFGDPPRDRHVPVDQLERMQVVDEGPDGIVIRGARAVATLAPFANEYVSLTAPRPELRREEMLYFALPVNAPGVHVICRQPLPSVALRDHPLGAIGDEMDAMVVFDNVVVPWERVFFLHRADLVPYLFGRVLAWASYHMLTRVTVKAEILVGIGAAMADYLGVMKESRTQDLLCELIDYAETLRAFIRQAEENPLASLSGLVLPNPNYLLLGRIHSLKHHAHILHVVRELCGSGLLMAPQAADMASEQIGPYISRFLVGADQRAPDRYRMLKLAWDYTGDSFAARQLLLELHAGATLQSNKARLVDTYSTEAHVELAKRLAGIGD